MKRGSVFRIPHIQLVLEMVNSHTNKIGCGEGYDDLRANSNACTTSLSGHSRTISRSKSVAGRFLNIFKNRTL